MKNFKQMVYKNLFEVKNPGKYETGRKEGYDDDGDGVPNGADKDPKDGAVQEEVEIAEELLEESDPEDTDE